MARYGTSEDSGGTMGPIAFIMGMRKQEWKNTTMTGGHQLCGQCPEAEPVEHVMSGFSVQQRLSS